MAASENPLPAPDSAHNDDWRRQHRRHRTNCLTCNLGEVLDLSRSGMRVDAPGRPTLKLGDVAKFTLHSPEGDLTVSGRTAWIRRKGLRRYEMGIEFLDVRRALAAALESLGRFGFLGTDRYVHSERSAPPPPAQGEQDAWTDKPLPDHVENLSHFVDSSLRRLGMKRKGRSEEADE